MLQKQCLHMGCGVEGILLCGAYSDVIHSFPEGQIPFLLYQLEVSVSKTSNRFVPITKDDLQSTKQLDREI